MSTPEDEWDDNLREFATEVRKVMTAAELVAEHRAMTFKLHLKTDPRQQLFEFPHP